MSDDCIEELARARVALVSALRKCGRFFGQYDKVTALIRGVDDILSSSACPTPQDTKEG